MEPSDRAAFSEGGTARDAYLPYLPLGNPSSPNSPNSLGNCALHTSDGNVQHSSCDEHGDCAVGHALPVGASADVTTGEPVDLTRETAYCWSVDIITAQRMILRR